MLNLDIRINTVEGVDISALETDSNQLITGYTTYTFKSISEEDIEEVTTDETN